MGRSRQRRWPAARTKAGAFALAFLVLGAGNVAGQPATLQLDVSINGVPSGLIGTFVLDGDGGLQATRGELTALGLSVPGTGSDDEIIKLSQFPNLRAAYDAASQSVAFTAPPELLVTRRYDAMLHERVIAAPRSPGLVVNYNGTVSADPDQLFGKGRPEASVTLEAHGSTPLGVVHQSGVVGTAVASGPALRLETTWSYSDEERLRSYRAGDIMTGSLPWTRPVRMGGVQVQRNFGLRPDIVTMPLPSARGSAVVPSTVDVYVGNVKTYSGAIGAGPFIIDNLPSLDGSTDARVVVTDVTGRKSEQKLDMITVPEMLRKGLVDFSLDAGFVRRSYGSSSFDYAKDPAASATVRYGLSDRLTLEGHAELSARIANAGAGLYLPLSRRLGVLNGGVAASTSTHGTGVSLFGAWRGTLGPFALQLAGSRSFGDFADLAAVYSAGPSGSGDPVWSAGEIPVDQERASIAYHWESTGADLRASVVHRALKSGKSDFAATAGISKSFENSVTVFADGFAGSRKEYGATLGVSFPLGKDVQAAGLGRVDTHGVSGWAQMQKSAAEEPGGYGWRIGKSAGEGSDALDASALYRGSLVQLDGGVNRTGGHTLLRVSADGSLVVANGGVFLAGKAGESYAVVDAGAPNVPVLLENKVIGKTGRNGKLLVPGLSAWQRSHLSLDVSALPVNAVIPSTEVTVVPRDYSGISAGFGVKTDVASAIVTIVDEAGHVLPAGTPLSLEGSSEALFVGYEGRAFITGLAAQNRFSAELATGSCSGEFKFAPKGDTQQVVGPVTCRFNG